MSEYKGKVIVIEGIDGSGKTTQTHLLMARLQRQGLDVRTQDFPRHGDPAFHCGDKYLTGAYGKDVKALGSLGPSILYTVDRFDFAHTEMIPELKKGTHYVLNRFIQSNYGHQGGKIDDDSERAEFFRKIDEIEFGWFGIPRWDFTVFLEVPPVLGRQFVLRKKESERRKGERAYLGEEKQDLHEQDLTHLINATKAYNHAGNYYGRDKWVFVDCLVPDCQGEIQDLTTKVLRENISALGVQEILRRPLEEYLLPPEQIHEKVFEKVQKFSETNGEKK